MVNELDPQVQALINQMHLQQQANSDSSNVYTLEEKVAQFRQVVKSVEPLGLPQEAVSEVRDFEIPGKAGNIPVRIYSPSIPDAPLAATLPALIHLHGGGFVAGDIDSSDNLARGLANRGRCIVISVDYRLAPEHPYPAANDDAWSALNWVHQHANTIGVNPEQLAVGGESAGGLLAAWVAQKAARNKLNLRLQILLCPNLDITCSMPSCMDLGTPFLSRAEMMERHGLYLPQGVDGKDPNVSPLFATDLTGVAPAFIVTADHDPLRDEAEAYAAKLNAAQIPVKYVCWQGMVHGFASLAGVLDAGKLLIDQTGAALRKAFE